MSKKSELKQAKEDQKWWQEKIGDPLGLILMGWTYKQSALFRDDQGYSVTIEGWLANRILSALAQ